MKKKYILVAIMILMTGFVGCSDKSNNMGDSDGYDEVQENQETDGILEEQSGNTDLFNEHGVAAHLVSNESGIEIFIKGMSFSESEIAKAVITLDNSCVDFTNQLEGYEAEEGSFRFMPYILLKSDNSETSGYNEVTVTVTDAGTKISIPSFGNQYFDMSDVQNIRIESEDILEICQISSYSKESTSVAVVSAVNTDSLFGSQAIEAGIEEYETDAQNISLNSDDYCLISEYDNVSYSGVYKDLGIFVFDETGTVIQCFRRQKMEPGEYNTDFVPGFDSNLVYEECDPIELALYYGIDLSPESIYPSQKEQFLYKEYARKQGDGWKYQTVYMSKPMLNEMQLGEIQLIKFSDFGVPEVIFVPKSDDYMVEQSTQDENYITAKGDEFVITAIVISCYEYDEAGKVVAGTRILEFEDINTAQEYANTRGGEQKQNYVVQEIGDITNQYKRNSLNCSKPFTQEQLEKQYTEIPIS